MVIKCKHDICFFKEQTKHHYIDIKQLSSFLQFAIQEVYTLRVHILQNTFVLGLLYVISTVPK